MQQKRYPPFLVVFLCLVRENRGVIGALHLPDNRTRQEWKSTLGRYCVERKAQHGVDLSAIFEKLTVYENRFNGNFEDRLGRVVLPELKLRNAIPPNVFNRSNASQNKCREITTYLSAKAFDEIFGTKPWAGVRPVGIEDKQVAEQVQHFVTHKISDPDVGFERAGREALTEAFAKGYSVIKGAVDEKVREAWVTSQVLVDKKGAPYIGADGEYFYDGDMIPSSEGDVTDEAPPQFEGKKLLKGGKKLLLRPEDFKWDTVRVLRKQSKRKMRVSHVRYSDFFFNPNLPSMEDQDFVCQEMDIRVNDLLRYKDKQSMLDAEAVKRIRESAEESPTIPSAQPRESELEHRTGASYSGSSSSDGGGASWFEQDHNKFIKVIECVFDYPVPRFDEKGKMLSGEMQNAKLYALVAVETREVIRCDYIENVNGGESPWEVITVNKKPGKMIGIGIFERYQGEQDLLDSIYNSIIYRNNYSANPTVFLQADKIQEISGPRDFKVGPDIVYTVKGSTEPGELYEIMELPQMEQISFQVLEMAESAMEGDSGVTPAVQGDTTSGASTAYGTQQILSQANVLHKVSIREIQESLERFTNRFVLDMVRFMDPAEEYTYREGEEMVSGEMRSRDMRNYKLDVRLLLNKFHQSEAIEQASQALNLLAQWEVLPPESQEKQRPLFLQALKAMGVDDADEILQITPLPPDGGGGIATLPAQGSPRQSAPGTQPSKRLSGGNRTAPGAA